MNIKTGKTESQENGTADPNTSAFGWPPFYQAIADKLSAFRSDRKPLVEGIRETSLRVPGLDYFAKDRYSDGTTGFVKDVCPFTTMGSFNRGSDERRKIIAAELAKFLNVSEAIPENFAGVPILNPLMSKFFGWEKAVRRGASSR
jgi:5-methylcytosine-specific restriction protein B